MSQRSVKDCAAAPVGGSSPVHVPEKDKNDVELSQEDLTITKSRVSNTGPATSMELQEDSESGLFNGTEKEMSPSTSKLTKKESLKVQKLNYKQEKKRATQELLSNLKDPSVVIRADCLKVRGTLKSWTKMWCVLKPGVFLIYKDRKSEHWVGTVMLNVCELIERPSKKDGFCFKLYHPLDQSIWAVKGPEGEAVGSITQPLPSSYLIVRSASESHGRCWMDALELALRCSTLHKRTSTKDGKEASVEPGWNDMSGTPSSLMPLLNPSDMHTHPKHLTDAEQEGTPFAGQGIRWDSPEPPNGLSPHPEESDEDGTAERTEDSDSDVSDRQDGGSQSGGSHSNGGSPFSAESQTEWTTYVEEANEELGEVGEAAQTETVSEENKGLIWTLLKQVRPGMDLSKVVLPTFILEPRSFLDKLSDYYYHADLLSKASLEENAYMRMKKVVQWYLSGFYKKPKGLKKPYNPIIGEIFRCLWVHPETDSKTFYIAEQVSHHPPVSAFYISNRKDGFCISGSILAKSKFYGNSLSAILDGEGTLTFLNRGEDYIMTMPYAHCKGILLGTMTLEFGGKVMIECEKTGYKAEVEFKLKPFLGSSDTLNMITGKIKLGKQTLCTLEGHWDQEVFIQENGSTASEPFWTPTVEIRNQRLQRCIVPQNEQFPFESEWLWQHVTQAILDRDQNLATHEKSLLEEAQRQSARHRKETGTIWLPRLFHQDISGSWHYRYSDTRPWDALNDVLQFEKYGVIRAKMKHGPCIAPVLGLGGASVGSKNYHSDELDLLKHKGNIHRRKCSTPDPQHQDSSDNDGRSEKSMR
uniref:oxysterol-binding protein-related protein 8-like isoform X2 n=1 Tax=Myxine glutinosa TaxID=7769 RepID=UPI00358FC94E